jgi:hypothetical protein
VPRIPQQERRHGGVHAPRERDDDARHGQTPARAAQACAGTRFSRSSG